MTPMTHWPLDMCWKPCSSYIYILRTTHFTQVQRWYLLGDRWRLVFLRERDSGMGAVLPLTASKMYLSWVLFPFWVCWCHVLHKELLFLQVVCFSLANNIAMISFYAAEKSERVHVLHPDPNHLNELTHWKLSSVFAWHQYLKLNL